MKRNVLISTIITLLSFTQLIAQKADTDTVIIANEDTLICNFDYHVPQFPGGNLALKNYIVEHIQYPQEADIEGTVIIKFIIEKDGSVSNVTIFRGIDPLADSEAVRVVRTLPKFKPGTVSGKPAKFWYTIPVVFKIENIH